ncbi:SDR family oxidoreductase [Actinomadura graeca]|uniref:SDR family oxidoreductase n=1 Tax=Actinomadura graeca TaxID=2750812 RepID=UPI003084063C
MFPRPVEPGPGGPHRRRSAHLPAHPGPGRRPGIGGRRRTRRTPDQARPSTRIRTSEEVARCALFLASDESSYVTRANPVVDGGWSAVLPGGDVTQPPDSFHDGRPV